MTVRFEAVPNFSEGRSQATVDALRGAAAAVSGVAVLDVEMNADHNRCVISLSGPGPELSEALFRMIRVAIERIDLTHHVGEHPRMGAADVVPFIPLGEATMDDAVRLAEALGERVSRELHLPVYLYAQAARRPERRDLAQVRKGGFEGIRDTIASDPSRRPDFGEAQVHPTAGIVAIGARPVLIAYNVYLASSDLAIAKQIAHLIRGRDGGLPEVKALGFEIKERGQVQVSMNLTDYRTTSIHVAFDAVRREAEARGVSIDESEIVGLVPEDALLDAAESYLKLKSFDRATILERKVRSVSAPASTGGPASLAGTGLGKFAELLAARTPTPGGGSAAAAAAAFGAALGEMVVAYSQPTPPGDGVLESLLRELRAAREEFLTGVDRDSGAYEELRATRKAWKSAPDDPVAGERYTSAVRGAIQVPLETARRARAVSRMLVNVRPRLKSMLASDLTTALALLDAAAAGALANASINLPDLARRGESVEALETEIEALRATPG